MVEGYPITITMTLESRDEALALAGPRDQHAQMIRDAFDVKVITRGGDVLNILAKEEQPARQAERALQQLRHMVRKQQQLSVADVKNVIDVIKGVGSPGGGAQPTALPAFGKTMRARTDGQGRYVQAMQENDVVICVGPAGTGKTFLAVAWAVSLLKSGAVKKIILVRPAVEAGERLGFLPGDLKEKINPYLRPLFDSLNDLLQTGELEKHMQTEVIEIVPLAYMRGRTLSNACMILDEGQNATVAQMKMFLTRMGFNSKVVVTGDMTQVDLPRTIRSGLADAVGRLKNIDNIAVIHLADSDIVRNPLVQKIVNAYEMDADRGRRT
jgi:phosphate starvation-inducible PhoH-like protein